MQMARIPNSRVRMAALSIVDHAPGKQPRLFPAVNLRLEAADSPREYGRRTRCAPRPVYREGGGMRHRPWVTDMGWGLAKTAVLLAVFLTLAGFTVLSHHFSCRCYHISRGIFIQRQ